jgi:hypothetical protein
MEKTPGEGAFTGRFLFNAGITIKIEVMGSNAPAWRAHLNP